MHPTAVVVIMHEAGSVFAHVEAAAAVSEMSGILHRIDANISRRAAERDAISLLARPLSMTARSAVVALLLSRWEDDYPLHLLSALRVTDQPAWVDTLVALGRRWELPVIRRIGVVGLIDRIDMHRFLLRRPRRRRRCRDCGREWVEEICWRRVVRICIRCGRTTRTSVTLAPPRPGPSYTQLPLFALPPSYAQLPLFALPPR